MTVNLQAQLEQLEAVILGRSDLDETQCRTAGQALIAEEVSVSAKKSFLAGLHEKGETPAEVAGFARFFRELALNPGLDAYASAAIDVVGTGGDRSGSFNVSTATSFVLASMGVPVFKHGNRSITSRSGSADVLEALGIPLNAEPEVLLESMERLNFVFLFAPAYHPAFKAVMPVRRELASEGRKSVFNIIGPLINPGRPAHQLLGVFSPAWVKPLAATLDAIPVKRGLVVHCRLSENSGMDELSHVGENVVAGAGDWDASHESGFRSLLQAVGPGDVRGLAGGDAQDNMRMMHELLNGGGSADLVKTVCLNAGVALLVVGKVKDAHEGYTRVERVLQDGSVAAWLDEARSFYSA